MEEHRAERDAVHEAAREVHEEAVELEQAAEELAERARRLERMAEELASSENPGTEPGDPQP